MKRYKLKQFLAATLAATMLLSTNAFATEINLENSNANVNKHGTVTKDLGSDTFDDETTNVWQNGSISEEVRVTVDRASRFDITIPKEIVLNGNDGSATYKVKCEGEIAGDQVISVVPDASFILNEDGGKQTPVTVTQPDTDFTYAELDISKEYDGSLSAPQISAGNWCGSFYFNIEFKEVSTSSPGKEPIYRGDLAIIMYKSGAPELVDPGIGPEGSSGLEPFIGWKCPGCQKESGYKFTQEGEACNDFKENHLPTCPKYDPVNVRFNS